MSIDSVRENLIYKMEQLESTTNNYYTEDGQYLIDRVEFDLESIEEQIQRCREALEEYAEALEREDDEDEE